MAPFRILNPGAGGPIYLNGTNFNGADLRGADFFPPLQFMPSPDGSVAPFVPRPSSFVAADLAGLDLSVQRAAARRESSGWDWFAFRDADFTRARLERVNLEGGDLTGATLREANLTGANLSRSNLTGADLSGANLTGAYTARAMGPIN